MNVLSIYILLSIQPTKMYRKKKSHVLNSFFYWWVPLKKKSVPSHFIPLKVIAFFSKISNIREAACQKSCPFSPKYQHSLSS